MLTVKTKIIFFLSPDVTGAERVSVTMAKHKDQEKYEVVFAILGNTFGDIISYIPHSCQCHLVPLLRLDDYLKQERPDEVFCSLIHLNGEVLTAAKKIGHIRVVLRNNYNLSDISEDLLNIAKETYPHADMVIAQTEQMKQELIAVCHVSEDKVDVIDNPIDTEYIDEHVRLVSSPYPEDGKIHFCWVGRYEKIKGVDLMLEAFLQVYQNHPNTSLYLIGKVNRESEYYQYLYRYVSNCNLLEAVHFNGFDKNPYPWIKHADSFLIPSRSEANSNVLKEATYLGTPTIYTSDVSEMATKMINIIESANGRKKILCTSIQLCG